MGLRFDRSLDARPRHPLSRSGLARRSDFATQEWQTLFRELEAFDQNFQQQRSRILDPDYPWPLDPLHTWSRAWEYPYTFYHLRRELTNKASDEDLRLLDYGSGVTFFPFAVASMGFRTTCADIDASFGRSIERASNLLPFVRRPLDFAMVTDGRLPVCDAAFDIIYCVSVLEHIPEPEEAVQEIVRVLRPGGLFILTIDICTSGSLEISAEAYQRLMDLLYNSLEIAAVEESVHPANTLTTANSLYRHDFFPHSLRGAILRRLHSTRHGIGSAALARLGIPAPELAVAGFTFRKPMGCHTGCRKDN